MRIRYLIIGISLSAATVGVAYALPMLSASQGELQTSPRQLTLLLRPHCDEPVVTCPEFHSSGNDSETPPLRIGDTLDIDLVLDNPGRQSVHAADVHISFDPNVLDEARLNIDQQSFPDSASDETAFSPERGIVHIRATGRGVSDATIPVARVTFRVARAEPGGSVLQFRYRTEASALAKSYGRDLSVLTLLSKDDPQGTPEPQSTVSDASWSHVEHFIATVHGESVQLSWTRPSAPDLKGYVILYGTVPGTYTASVKTNSSNTSYTVHGLEHGRTYYFAIRPERTDDAMGALSDEVFTTVGVQEYVGDDAAA